MQLEEFCDAWLAAWTGGDVEKLVAYYADGCFYSDPTKTGGVRGKEELRHYLAKWLPQYERMVWTREALHPLADGRSFAVTWTARIPVKGAWLVERGMDLVLLDEHGKIARNEVYFDMAAWRAALGR